MLEARVAVKPAEFLYLECQCSQCKEVTPISMAPPREDDSSIRQCAGCGIPFPSGLNMAIKKFQDGFVGLRAIRDFDLRFVVKQ